MLEARPLVESDITHVLFDVDGTMYDGDSRYGSRVGSVYDSHDFFRLWLYKRLSESSNLPEEYLLHEAGRQYRQRVSNGTLLDCLEHEFTGRLKADYKADVERFTSNGRVFSQRFGRSKNFLAKALSQIDFAAILRPDQQLQEVVESLHQRGYNTGILTTEVYETVQKVLHTLGLQETYFDPIICSGDTRDPKPSLGGFMRILHETQKIGSQVMYIGDSFHKDVVPALRMGMVAVQVDRKVSGLTKSAVDIKSTRRSFHKVGSLRSILQLLPVRER
ncbi:hypothetical protein COV20_06270 [Candidatus Woesearchaeota archaeon CG10_big_fil_rev_8_21_14_0_10_45_16]|nr:MAG: hypothetical protein COV20_06270 [Candidatus Woesearchaeota archaeon CG10_big_fil_rev_8_21_14_0_10_45_16]